MTRINSAIDVSCLTDEHLLAEHREIKRLPFNVLNSIKSGSFNKIPKVFCLGPGHVTFFFDKQDFILKRYLMIHEECLKRGFEVENYKDNWNQLISIDCWKSYITTPLEKRLLQQRITARIESSSKPHFHYYGKRKTKEESIMILNKN